VANEQCSSLGSMCMFIEFGRLGCKHIIYLGDVYVPLAAYYKEVWCRQCIRTHMTFWLKLSLA